VILYEFSICIIKDHIQVKIIVIEMTLLQIFVMACLSAEEGHTPPGYPQGSKFLLKTFKIAKRKCHITHLNAPENIHSKQNSHLLHADRGAQYKINAKRIMSFGLIE
jgi:hypothetical protein